MLMFQQSTDVIVKQVTGTYNYWDKDLKANPFVYGTEKVLAQSNITSCFQGTVNPNPLEISTDDAAKIHAGTVITWLASRMEQPLKTGGFILHMLQILQEC